MSIFTESDHKLAELILYVSKKSVFDPKFGATKLNKILYFSDFHAYGQWGESITGAEYQNLRNGPAPRRLVPVRDHLIENNDLVVQSVRLSSGHTQNRSVNLREPDLSLFNAKGIALVDEVISALSGLGADDVSELSHSLVGWKSTKVGETISYGTIFLSDEPLSPAEIRRGRELAAEMEQAVA